MIKLFCMLLIADGLVLSAPPADMVVDQNGHGDFTTITAAIDALPMYPYQRTVIYIKNGVYEEKVRIEQNYITLRGESRDSTIIRYSQLREDWIKNKDYIGPAVVNIHGDDFVLDNLTVENSQPEIGPHAFSIYGVNTRTVITNCNVISKGGDTVSLWDYKDGMYYHANCTFQGAVDFVCPRGWCFIRDCQFYEVKETAALWHAGHYLPDQKFVLRNCAFDGVKGFQLGRHHYEAQFYLLDCRFSANMADRPIYKVLSHDSTKNNPYFNGERKYFCNCQKEGQPYAWYGDNLDLAVGQPVAQDITSAWTFDGRWDPESQEPVKVTDHAIDGHELILTFDEIVTVRSEPFFKNRSGKIFRIVMRRFNDINKLTFVSDQEIHEDDLQGELSMQSGDIIASVASVRERSVGLSFRIMSPEVE